MAEKFDKYYKKFSGLRKEIKEGGIVNISGGARLSGGRYKEINISGGATIEGDIEAEGFTVSGGATVKGGVQVGLIRIAGGVTMHHLHCDKAEIAGGLTISKGSLIANKGIDVGGATKVNGDLIAKEYVEVSGGLYVQGKLKTDILRIKLSGSNSEVRSGIEARCIKILASRRIIGSRILSKIYSFIGLKRGKLYTPYIKGEFVEIEDTICDVVEGNIVRIGRGCIIKREVRYRESIEVDKESIVASTKQFTGE